MQVEKISTQKVSDQVAEQIKGWIVSGDVQPGDQLPSVRELCDMFHVGRSAVRDALTTLKGKGLVEVRHGEGTFVTEISASQLLKDLFLLDSKNIQDLYQARKMLEISTAELASLESKEHHIQNLEDIMGALHNNKDLDSWSADYHFHMALAEATNNTVLVQIMKTLSGMMEKTLMGLHQVIASEPHISQLISEQHQAIFEAVRDGHPQQARERMYDHLTYVEALLQRLIWR